MKKVKSKDEILTIAKFIQGVLDAKKGKDIEIIDISDRSSLADYFVIASAASSTQVKAMVSDVEEKVLEEFSLSPLRSEGFDTRKWVLLDYGDLVLHVFLESEREYYDLERLWKRDA